MPIGPFTLSAHIPENVSVCLDLLMSDASQKQQMDQTDLASHLISEFFNTNVSAFALYDQTDFIISLKQQQNSLTSPLSLSLSNIGNNTISSRRASSFSEKSSSASIIAPPSSSLALEPPPDYLLHAMFAVTAAKSNHPALLNQDSNNIFWNSPETAAAYWADLAFKAVCTSSVSTSTTSISTSLHIHQTMLILVDYYNSQQDIQKCVFLMFELIKVAKFHAWGKLAVEDIQGNGNQTTVTVKNALMYKLVWACVFWVKKTLNIETWCKFKLLDHLSPPT